MQTQSSSWDRGEHRPRLQAGLKCFGLPSVFCGLTNTSAQERNKVTALVRSRWHCCLCSYSVLTHASGDWVPFLEVFLDP